MYEKNITLADGVKYELDFDFMGMSNRALKNWCALSFEPLYPPTPVVIRSYEDDISTFSILRTYAADNLSNVGDIYTNTGFYSTNKYLIYKRNPFPGYQIDGVAYNEHDALSEKVIQAWTYGSKYLLPFFHRLMRSKNAREEIYEYLIATYKKITRLIPRSVKRKTINVCSLLLAFIDTYKTNRTKYLTLSRSKNFLDEVNLFEAFLFRRFELDKVPISEVRDFLFRFQAVIKNDTISPSPDHLFKIDLNDSELMIADGIKTNYILASKNTSTQISFNQLYYIKCFRTDVNNYLIKYDNKEILVNNRLEEIKR